MHVCIGLNEVKEASWAKDYTLLEAFCFEAIFENETLKAALLTHYRENKENLPFEIKQKYA